MFLMWAWPVLGVGAVAGTDTWLNVQGTEFVKK